MGCGRTACGQSVNVASERVDKAGTTRLRRVAPTLPTLIHSLTTLRRTSAAARRGRLRRNNNKSFLNAQKKTIATHTKRNRGQKTHAYRTSVLTDRDRLGYKKRSSAYSMCTSVTFPGMGGHLRRNTHFSGTRLPKKAKACWWQARNCSMRWLRVNCTYNRRL
jgi:hypothetical protein